MIITILLCMVFVVNVGVTFALTSYSFSVGSINISTTDGDTTTTKAETYTEYANATGSSAQYTYSIGSANNQLSINYGFSHPYDLLVKFTATYADGNHSATDFSLNFVNRDKWCIDMATATGPSVNSESESVSAQTYYSLSSSSNSISGVMYYMGTVEGSATLPIISGVTFYTSPNNSYENIGDTLIVTLTPEYVKADDAKYTASHSFASSVINAGNTTAFDNWIAYMSGEYETADTSTYMIYNAYTNSSTGIAYPKDFDISSSGYISSTQTEPTYANTAYRYSVNKVLKDGSTTEYVTNRSYASVIAGNKYYGGVGLYVIPASNLVTVSVAVEYRWVNGLIREDGASISTVEVKYNDNDITEIKRKQDGTPITDSTEPAYTSYHYRDTIDAPTYINILDHIKLTASSGYETILINGYKLIISNVIVVLENDNPTTTGVVEAPSGWTAQDRNSYEINNASTQSPILVRVKDVAASSKQYQTNVALTNYGSAMAVTSFTVKAKLWYADYISDGGVTSQFKEVVSGYLQETPVDNALANNTLIYDKSMWEVAYSNDVFTFTRKNTLAHIPTGYSMTLISGVTMPAQYYPAANDPGFDNGVDDDDNPIFKPIMLHDLWCSLEVNITGTTSPSYSSGSYTGAEVSATGYYSTITANNSAYIYLRNNTNQNITAVNLTNLRLATFNTDNSGLLPRDNMNTATQFNYSLTNNLTNTTSSTRQSTTNVSDTTSNIVIRPNERVLLYTIVPKSNAVIYSYTIIVTLASGEENKVVDIVLNTNTKLTGTQLSNTGAGDIVNNSDNYKEFRLVSKIDLTDSLVDSNLFVERTISGTYYYYYKGTLCPHQAITAFKSSIANVTIDYLDHNAQGDANYYVASNYTAWSLNDTNDKAWFDVMKAIYGEPDRDNAITVSAS